MPVSPVAERCRAFYFPKKRWKNAKTHLKPNALGCMVLSLAGEWPPPEMRKGETMKITIRNNYHNTEASVTVNRLPADISKRQVDRIRRALCGISGCTCGNALGARGPQDVDIEDAPWGVRLYERES